MVRTKTNEADGFKLAQADILTRQRRWTFQRQGRTITQRGKLVSQVGTFVFCAS